MKQTTATRRAASVFHRTVARDPFSIEESTTEDRARRDMILKGLNGQVRDRLIAPTRHRTYWLKKQAKKRRDSLTEVLSILRKGIYLFEGRYSCTGIEVIRTELSLPARNEEATDR